MKKQLKKILWQKKNFWLFNEIRNLFYYTLKKFFTKKGINFKYNKILLIKQQLFMLKLKEVKLTNKLIRRRLRKSYKLCVKKLPKLLKHKIRVWKYVTHYKWYRYEKKLPLNGQRTKTNSRTIRKFKWNIY